MSQVIILFSEKKTLVTNKKFDYYNIYGTFIPSYDSIKEKFYFKGKQIEEYKKIIKKYQNAKIIVFIGYDLDENGEFLSHIIEEEIKEINNLSNNNISIYRTPLTENNFILFKEPIKIDEYIQYRKIDINFIKKQKESKINQPIGILKAIALYMLYKYKNTKFKINKEGTSTFTFLLKYLKETV